MAGRGRTAKGRKGYFLYILPDLMKQVQHMSVDEEVSASDLVNEAVRDFLSKKRDVILRDERTEYSA